jgi:hypothetical protein
MLILEVQEITLDNVITKLGVIKKKLTVYQSLVERFDGQNLWFRITKEEAENMCKTKD